MFVYFRVKTVAAPMPDDWSSAPFGPLPSGQDALAIGHVKSFSLSSVTESEHTSIVLHLKSDGPQQRERVK